MQSPDNYDLFGFPSEVVTTAAMRVRTAEADAKHHKITILQLNQTPLHWRCTTRKGFVFDFWPSTYTTKLKDRYIKNVSLAKIVTDYIQ
jgi:hypothetical protein